MRGDVHELRTPRGARSNEQSGARLAVVVQSDALPLSTWLVAPTSTSAQDASFRPAINIGGRSTLVLTEQTVAVDPQRLGPVVGHVSATEQTAIDVALRVVLGLR